MCVVCVCTRVILCVYGYNSVVVMCIRCLCECVRVRVYV